MCILKLEHSKCKISHNLYEEDKVAEHHHLSQFRTFARSLYLIYVSRYKLTKRRENGTFRAGAISQTPAPGQKQTGTRTTLLGYTYFHNRRKNENRINGHGRARILTPFWRGYQQDFDHPKGVSTGSVYCESMCTWYMLWRCGFGRGHDCWDIKSHIVPFKMWRVIVCVRVQF